MRPSTMNVSLQSQLPFTTSRIPEARTTRDAGMKTQGPTALMSFPYAADRAGSPEALASAPNTCATTPPPIQIATPEMWTNNQSSYQVTSSPQPRTLSRSQPTETFTSQTTIVAPTYVQKPSMEKSGVSHSASASMSTLIAKYARPNVRMMSGSVRIARIGLMIVLPIVRIAAANSRDPQRPISTPLNIQSMTMSARVLIPQRTRSAIQIIVVSARSVRTRRSSGASWRRPYRP